jgi:hypothetical protein
MNSINWWLVGLKFNTHTKQRIRGKRGNALFSTKTNIVGALELSITEEQLKIA